MYYNILIFIYTSNNLIIQSWRNNTLISMNHILERESAFRRVGLFNFSAPSSLSSLGRQSFSLSCFFFHGTKSVFNKSSNASPRGKADAAHYQCPSLTAISYHPLLNYTERSSGIKRIESIVRSASRGCFII